jgi:hypothetical protein
MHRMSTGGEIGNAFGSERPFSLGVEEELFLVDPVTGRQANASRPCSSGSEGCRDGWNRSCTRATSS